MRVRTDRWTGLVAAVGLLAAACGGPSAPSVDPLASEPDETAAGGPFDGCRPALTDDDPHPFDAPVEGNHPAFSGEDWIGPVAQEVNGRHADVLGGLWLDQAAGEVVVMVPSGVGREVFEDLRASAAQPERVVCMEAAYTASELETLLHSVTERLAGLGPASGGIDTIRNQVSLDIEGDLDEARAALGDLADHAALRLSVPACAEVLPPPDGAVLLHGGGSTCGGMDALAIATLAGDPATGCVWFEGEDGQLTNVIWPRGWWISPDGEVHDHRGELRARLGDEVEAGGGHVDAASSLPEACRVAEGEGAWVLSSLAPR